MNLLDKQTWLFTYRKGLIEYLLDQGAKDEETIVMEWFEKGSKVTSPEFLKETCIVSICKEIICITYQLNQLEDKDILLLQSTYEDNQIEFESSLNRETYLNDKSLLKELNL